MVEEIKVTILDGDMDKSLCSEVVEVVKGCLDKEKNKSVGY